MKPQYQEQKKYSYLDQFKIIKTLGSGYHAQVKLGTNQKGELFAIKRYKKETANLETLLHELNIMKTLKHDNLVQLIDVRENAVYKKKDQTTFKCFAIILEYVGGGELFDYVAQTGRFSQKVARTYFHQMMSGLNYMHQKGYAHRDIKPQNILLGKDHVLKLADFGFSCLLQGKDGSGILHTKLGTEGYMAPQIPTKNYEGAKIDIFATGVILFVMYAGSPPFQRASINDAYYKLIKEKEYAVFWKSHSKRRPLNFFNQQFKHLFVKMVAYNPKERPTMTQIADHPWVKNPIYTLNQLKQQFDQRTKKLHIILQQKRKKEEEQKAKRMINVNNHGGMRGGDLQVQQSNFMEIFNNQRNKNRKIGRLQPINTDDFIINEGIAYAIALLKDFVKNKSIKVQDQYVMGGHQALALKSKGIHELQDGIQTKYQLNQSFEGLNYKHVVQVVIRFGITSQQKLLVSIHHKSGNRLYFKKIAKEIRNIYNYCKI